MHARTPHVRQDAKWNLSYSPDSDTRALLARLEAQDTPTVTSGPPNRTSEAGAGGAGGGGGLVGADADAAWAGFLGGYLERAAAMGVALEEEEVDGEEG
jgi:hypothetical protein